MKTMSITTITTINGTTEYRVDNIYHRDDGPAIEFASGDRFWFQSGKLHREDGPAVTYFNRPARWFLDGVEYSEEEFNKKMNIVDPTKSVMTTDLYNSKHWKLADGKYHREDGPALEHSNGTKLWYKHGKLHRDGGPAVEYAEGWWVDGIQFTEEEFNKKMKIDTAQINKDPAPTPADPTKSVMTVDSGGTIRWKLPNGLHHREDGPAYEEKSGYKQWIINGQLHREDGPAIEGVGGVNSWWLEGRGYTKKKYDAEMKVRPIMIERKSGTKEWYQNGVLHRLDAAAVEFANGDKSWYENGLPHRADGPTWVGINGSRAWWINGKRHRTDGPARIQFMPNGNQVNEWYLNGIQLTEEEFNKKMSNTPVKTVANNEERWHLNGKLHREDGAAWTEANGDKHWMFNNLHHRLDGPAFEAANGAKSWWVNGKRHREDGPARIDSKGNKEWYLDGEAFGEKEFNTQLKIRADAKAKELKNGLVQGDNGNQYWYKDGKYHRDDGPAVVMPGDGEYWYKDGKQHRDGAPAVLRETGDKIWMINGRVHREDGPAFEHANGTKEWFIDGQSMSKEQFLNLTTKSNEKKEGIKVANEVTFMDRIKADATEAGYRVAATQFTAAIKGGILLLFKDKGFDESKLSVVKEMLESEFGTAMVSAVLGYGLVYMPKLKDDARIVKLAKEFRVNGMAVAGNEIMGIGIQYMMPALTKAMESLPPIQEVMPPVLRKKTGKKRVHTAAPQIPQGETATEEKTASV